MQILPLESGWFLYLVSGLLIDPSPVQGPELEVSVASDFPVYQDKNAVAPPSRRVGSVRAAGYQGLC